MLEHNSILLIASEQIFKFPESKQRFNRERYLRLLLKQGKLTEAIDFLGQKGIRPKSSLKIFHKLNLNNTSEGFGGVA